MKKLVITAVAAVACTLLVDAQTARQASSPSPQAASAADAANQDRRDGLIDLDAMTFACPRAALNAAAREAKKVPSKGTYQFSYFKIINYSHHSSYEVHFKSNYQEEADLKYCVAMYCQQGWDPRTTQTLVTLIGSKRQSRAGGDHVSDCSHKQSVLRKKSVRRQ